MTAPFDADDELRGRLRASDPAASLPPADPTRVARLLEDVMSTELTTENRETGTRLTGPQMLKTPSGRPSTLRIGADTPYSVGSSSPAHSA